MSFDPSSLISALPWAACASFLTVLWKTRVPMRQMALNSDAKFREDLIKQLKEQEDAHKSELASVRADAKRLEDKLETQRVSYEARLEYERVSHAGEMTTFRHKVNNLEASLSMLLELIETNPEKASDSARRVRERREKQEAAEAAEKATIAAARITANAPTPAPAVTPQP